MSTRGVVILSRRRTNAVIWIDRVDPVVVSTRRVEHLAANPTSQPPTAVIRVRASQSGRQALLEV